METRYYLANKQSWSDVTTSVTPGMLSKVPKKGDIVNVGKVRMTVKDVVDASVHGKPIKKVMLESLTESETRLVDLVEMLDEPTILGINEPINEATIKLKGNRWDNRLQQSNVAPQDSWGQQFRPCTIELGQYIRTGLGSLGAGVGAQVADFGDAVSVTVTYSNAKTGRCSSQSFVVLWQPDRNPKYPYKVYASISRYRSCAGVDQAIGFIRSKISALSGTTSGVL